MEPLSIIIGACIVGVIFLAIVFLAPKIREYNEQVRREEAELQSLIRRKGWSVETPAQGDIKWKVSSAGWHVHFDSDFSSESSNPYLIWFAETPKSARSRFAVLTEAGFKMMNHPWARKTLVKFSKLSPKILKAPANGQKVTSPMPAGPSIEEVLNLLDAKCNIPFGKTSTQQLILVADSATTIQKVKVARVSSLADQLFQHEKSRVNDNSERLAQFPNRIEIKFYHARPTAEHLQNIVKLGEHLLSLQL